MEQYEALMQALEILEKARRSQRILGPENPAWRKLFHASQLLGKQAAHILSEEVVA